MKRLNTKRSDASVGGATPSHNAKETASAANCLVVIPFPQIGFLTRRAGRRLRPLDDSRVTHFGTATIDTFPVAICTTSAQG